MRFGIALTGVLATEGLVSSVDAAHETPSSQKLQEITRLRKYAIEAISYPRPNSDIRPNGHRNYPLPRTLRQWSLLRRRLRRISQHRLRRLSGAADSQQGLKNTNSDISLSDSIRKPSRIVPEIGIISSPVPEEPRQKRLQKGRTQAMNPLRQRRGLSGRFGSQDDTIDLGILSSVPITTPDAQKNDHKSSGVIPRDLRPWDDFYIEDYEDGYGYRRVLEDKDHDKRVLPYYDYYGNEWWRGWWGGRRIEDFEEICGDLVMKKFSGFQDYYSFNYGFRRLMIGTASMRNRNGDSYGHLVDALNNLGTRPPAASQEERRDRNLQDQVNCNMLGSDIPDTGVLNALGYQFDNYFESLCAVREGGTQEFSCRACGRKPTNESVSFSFEIDCPERLSASNNGFGSYMMLAETFCNCPAKVGVQCSTCEVNPWEATINIEDCVPISDGDEDLPSCANAMDYTSRSRGVSFMMNYATECSKEAQSFMKNRSCECSFDESTQTASSSCVYNEVNRYSTLYCPENPLKFGFTYQIDTSFTRDGTLSFQKCVNFTSPYDFSYCVNSSITDDGTSEAMATAENTTEGGGSRNCEMEVDGVLCTSCSFVHNEGRHIPGFAFGVQDVDIVYNCNNTVIGTNGPGNLSTYKILDDTVSYFLYKSLPCTNGCDLCGVGDSTDGTRHSKSELMSNPDGMFSSELWNNGTEERCFDVQLDAMKGNPVLNNEECQALRDTAREPCGCKDRNPSPPPSAGTISFGNQRAIGNILLLTIAAASVASFL